LTISYKTEFFGTTAVRISNPTQQKLSLPLASIGYSLGLLFELEFASDMILGNVGLSTK
jgi:hypothetical protein